MTTTQATRNGRRGAVAATITAAAVIVALAWFPTRGTPREVDITAAVDQLATAEATAGATTGATAEAAATPTAEAVSADVAGTADGTWAVAPSGERFSVEDTTGTFVGFRIDEELTVNGVPVDVPLQVAVTDDAAVVTGSFDVALADYGVEAPTAPVVLSVEDHATAELQLFLTPA